MSDCTELNFSIRIKSNTILPRSRCYACTRFGVSSATGVISEAAETDVVKCQVLRMQYQYHMSLRFRICFDLYVQFY